MSRGRSTPLRVAIDTGGTFTDCVWFENGELKTLKVFSTPDDPSRAIGEALERIEVRTGVTLLHGTTVGTNALLQRVGARVALVTTAGFEDVIEIGRQARPKLYDLFFERIEPLVRRESRFGVEERTDAVGNILVRPSQKELDRLREAVCQGSPESIAISLLFSFANPANEMAVAEALRELGIPVSVSHEILPEFREYERTSTVVVNAYLQPLMGTYLQRLALRVMTSKSSRGNIFVMQSSGGITTLDAAAREPVRTVLSGPAGGLVGAAEMARRSGIEKIITFDMGGTSTDVALIDGIPRPSSQAEVAGFPIGVPMLDIHTVGAGGGSLARFDSAGALRVGPESAGADPGPICYGRGTRPTVTDANLLLGRLLPDRFLGGEFTLDVERTQKLTMEWLREQHSHLSLEQFAAGVVRVVNATMERALRVVSIERGYDPREFTLVAFGGAGGLHACELAESLGMPTVLLPARPGALSAYGILVSDVVKDFSRTLLLKFRGEIPDKQLAPEFRKLEQAAKKEFRAEGWNALPGFDRSADLRYRGQGYELNIPVGDELASRFHAEHQRRYGYCHPDREIELVTLRLRATLSAGENQETASGTRRNRKNVSGARTMVSFGGKLVPTAIYERTTLASWTNYKGPAIVAEYSATTVVPPGKKLRVDGVGNLLITIKDGKVRR